MPRKKVIQDADNEASQIFDRISKELLGENENPEVIENVKKDVIVKVAKKVNPKREKPSPDAPKRTPEELKAHRQELVRKMNEIKREKTAEKRRLEEDAKANALLLAQKDIEKRVREELLAKKEQMKAEKLKIKTEHVQKKIDRMKRKQADEDDDELGDYEDSIREKEAVRPTRGVSRPVAIPQAPVIQMSRADIMRAFENRMY